MNYYLLIFSFLRSGIKAKARRWVPPIAQQTMPRKIRRKVKNGVPYYTMFSLPTLLCDTFNKQKYLKNRYYSSPNLLIPVYTLIYISDLRALPTLVSDGRVR